MVKYTMVDYEYVAVLNAEHTQAIQAKFQAFQR